MGRLIETYTTIEIIEILGITVKRISVAVLVGLILVQIAAPVVASTPSSITIDPHNSSVSTDQVLQFTATVKDFQGSVISSPINWTSSSGQINSEGLFTPGIIGTAMITACLLYTSPSPRD